MKLKAIILSAFVLSGMAALIYEIVWIRPLQFVLGSTIYTASIIFAAFMAGLALGSFIASKYADKIKNLPATYAFLELGIGLYGVLLLVIFNILPQAYTSIYAVHQNFYLFEFLQFLIAFGILLIPTTLMGATFPIVVKFYTESKIGKGIGEVYSANNLGAIIGSFAAGFIFVPLLGIKAGIIFAASINIIIASIILLVSAPRIAKNVVLVSFIVFVALAFIVKYDVKDLYAGGFTREDYPQEVKEGAEFLYYKEGLHATISVVKDVSGATVMMINGKGQGSSIITDLRVNFLLAYLPLIIQPDAENALVVGLGTGTTSGQLSQFIDTTTVEIEPAVIGATDYFWFMNMDVLNNQNHNLVMGDGRNFLLRSDEKYDLIVPEPSDPWQSFSTALYSKEFFELSKEHLTADGLYVQWVPIYELDTDSFKSVYNTFSSVFPYVTAFASIKEDENLPVNYVTPEIILIGSKQKLDLNAAHLKNNFEMLPERTKQDLEVIRIESSDKLLHLLLFTEEQMQGYGADAPEITDDNPLLEFSTAKRVLNQNPEEVLEDIEKFIENG